MKRSKRNQLNSPCGQNTDLDMSIWKKIKDWYEGEYIPYENDPYSGIVFLCGHQKRPAIAIAISAVLSWWRSHLSIEIVVAIASLVVGIMALR